MTKFRFTLKTLVLTAFVLSFASLAQAQATRTWVSGVGDDINPCSRTAPCKTFPGAISKTAVNGEINVMDPGSFGALTITKSLTVDGSAQHSGMLASSVTGITINLTTAVNLDPLGTVRLKNLSINGTGSCGAGCGTRTGVRGINVSSVNTRAVKLFVDKLFIHGFVNEGILFNGPGGELSVKNTEIVDNGGSGIRVDSTAAGVAGIVHVTVDGTTTNLNQQGVRFEDNAFGTIKNSTASNNSLNGFVVLSSTSASEMNVMDSTANNNKSFGVFSQGFAAGTAVVRLINVNAIHNSVLQLEVSTNGQICTNQKNHIGTPSDAPNCNFLDQ